MNTTTTSSRSILASLRALTPRAQLTFEDTQWLAERQASKLLELLDCTDGSVRDDRVASMPRLRIVRETLPTSGLSYWTGTEWIIALNSGDSPARQRFTLLHEFKHIIDHPHARALYRNQWQAERAADYFAGCALIPKRELKRVFCGITQDIEQLATHFGVSREAIRVRLEQTGVVDPDTFTFAPRCARPVRTPSRQSQRFRIVQPSPHTRRFA